MGGTIKKFLCGLAIATCASVNAQDVKLVYPTEATAAQLDNSTPEKRIAAPPVREEAEIDAETPLGQVRGVLTALQSVEAKQRELAESVKAIKSDSTPELFRKLDELSKTAREERGKLAEASAAIITSEQTMTDELKALQGKIAGRSAARRVTDVCAVVVLLLLLVQIGTRLIKALSEKAKENKDNKQNALIEAAAAALEKKFNANCN